MQATDLEARMLGKHNDELVRDLFAPDMLEPDIVSLHGFRKEALYRKMMSPVLDEKLVPGVREFIVRHKKEPLGVASNAEPANVDFVLEAAGLREYFNAIANGHDVQRPKPFPDIYVKVAGMLGCSPADCVVFEDSATGVQAARAAGAKVVGVRTTVSTFTDVDLTISDFLDPELEPWLQALAVSR